MMEIDNLTTEVDTRDETRRARRRQMIQQAITLAMQSRWQEAADVNSQLVAMVPDDAEAFNRLGKAHTELGQVTEAREAYEGAMRADPANLIAQRNLDRLSRITDAEAADLAKKAGQKLDPRFFMEETGKTGVTVLLDVAGPETLATLTAGDQIQLEERDGRLVVTLLDGRYVGRVEDHMAARLTRFMQTGNEYQAGVVGVDGATVRIIIRETRQAPENTGRISFPPRVSSDALPRPYLREGLIRRAVTDEDEDEDSDVDISDVDADDEEEDASEFGFHEGTLDET